MELKKKVVRLFGCKAMVLSRAAFENRMQRLRATTVDARRHEALQKACNCCLFATFSKL